MLVEGSTAPTLTDREREVACLLARGMVRKQVATELGIALKTVEAHVQNIANKLPGDGVRMIRIARFVLTQPSTRAA